VKNQMHPRSIHGLRVELKGIGADLLLEVDTLYRLAWSTGCGNIDSYVPWREPASCNLPLDRSDEVLRKRFFQPMHDINCSRHTNLIYFCLNGHHSSISTTNRFQELQALMVHLPPEEQFSVVVHVQFELFNQLWGE
jgi:hypothetical protein